MSPTISVHLAQSRSEFEQALELLQKSRERAGLTEPSPLPRPLWLTKFHALPSTNTVVATANDKVIGALCVFGDNPFLLPLERGQSLTAFRSNLGGRVAEISYPGLDPDYAENRDLLFALHHFALCFGSTCCHYDGFVIEADAAWAERHAGELGFQPVLDLPRGQRLHYLNSRDCTDLRAGFSAGFRPQFRFPEKKFFLVAHQTMPPETFHFLFNERTQLFRNLSDLEMRVLQNIYDFGEYAKSLPSRALQMPYKKTPKNPRFPMNCEGFLKDRRGERIHLQVLDVSREGLKVRAEQVLQPGACYAITLYVGVKQKSEVIANAVWADEIAEICGLKVHSGDENWAKMIEYLEKDFLRTAA